MNPKLIIHAYREGKKGDGPGGVAHFIEAAALHHIPLK